MNKEVTASASNSATLLFIDDEANILAALKRLFRPQGYNILIAESGAEALVLMEKEPVDLVISDMRMPHMSGAEVLEQIRLKWPDAVRILLTGFSDIGSTIAAINRGEIYRYISKPWNDDDILLLVRDALERKNLLAEKQRLEELTLRQNLLLKEMNISLEEKVAHRTEELHNALERLKKDYFSTLQVFSNLMELRKGAMAGHSRRVAQLCRNVADNMHLSEAETHKIETAALLHNLGKIGLPDYLLDKPYMELNNAERAEFEKHPLRAASALMALDPLAKAAELIRHYRENYNGEGNVSRLHGEMIPLGARILRVASDYEELQQGLINHDKLTPAQALQVIIGGRNSHYDPIIVDKFSQMMSQAGSHAPIVTEFLVNSDQLHEGMLLTRDVLTNNGMLLLLKNTTLSAGHINGIRQFERTGEQLTIYTHSI